ncbi:MAG: universal stress protein [Desulfobacterales bacterium]|nr:universal stress protein [Desulfobacterales bacterium]
MFDLIIAALDGSDHSLKALDYARELAEKHGGKLLLLHAYRETSDLRGGDSFNEKVAKRKRAGEQIMKAARSRLGEPAFEMEEDLLEGPAADAIVSAAEAHRADLIVMGTRGMGAVAGVVFGSVSTKVAHDAPCPVMVVR